MGNCLRRSKKLTECEKIKPEALYQNMVMSKLQEENEADDEKGSCKEEPKVVRIKVMLTKQELRQILSYKKGCSVDQLVSALKLEGRKISQVVEGVSAHESTCRSWRPSLESIPE